MDSDYRIRRGLESHVFDGELTGRQMVFLAGPRQVGKTTFAKNWLSRQGCAELYCNWDVVETRQEYLVDSRFLKPSYPFMGNPSGRGAAAVRTACGGGNVRLVVEDNGGGIPEEAVDRLFELCWDSLGASWTEE